ncbi:MAG TPA: EthD family reductase [Ramlibacter sp.]|nr:EthD family reductase [Ramlibacter sp.]
MIRLNIMYPSTEGGRFDHDYYRDKHMPMVASRLGGACLYYAVERAISGAVPGTPSPYVAGCSIYSESMETLLRALGVHGKEMMADMKNYTDSKPVIWYSEVQVDRS